MGPIVFFALALFRPGDDPLPREWNQPHGNAAGTSFVDVVPLKAPPAERWRIKSEQILAGPVVSQGKLFFVARIGDAKELKVVDLVTGASFAKTPLDPASEVASLVVGDGLAALFGPAAIELWRLTGGELKQEKRVAGAFTGEPARLGALLVTPKGKGGFQWVDANAGKALALVAKGFGRPSFGGDSMFVLSTDEKEANVTLSRFPLLSATPPVKVGPAEALFTGPMGAVATVAQDSVLVAARTKGGTEWFAWYGGSNASSLLRKANPKAVGFRAAPAATGSHLYGVDPDDRLVDFDVNDVSITPLVEKEQLRKGAQLGAPSLARDTLFLGNWAVEIGGRRVLWCLETIEADGPAIPAGDELLVIKTKGGELVGFGNGKAGGKGGDVVAADPKAAAAAKAAPPTALPGSKPGLVRADGLFLPGKVSTLTNRR